MVLVVAGRTRVVSNLLQYFISNLFVSAQPKKMLYAGLSNEKMTFDPPFVTPLVHLPVFSISLQHC